MKRQTIDVPTIPTGSAATRIAKVNVDAAPWGEIEITDRSETNPRFSLVRPKPAAPTLAETFIRELRRQHEQLHGIRAVSQREAAQ